MSIAPDGLINLALLTKTSSLHHPSFPISHIHHYAFLQAAMHYNGFNLVDKVLIRGQTLGLGAV